jgi:hypothetical protein
MSRARPLWVAGPSAHPLRLRAMRADMVVDGEVVVPRVIHSEGGFGISMQQEIVAIDPRSEIVPHRCIDQLQDPGDAPAHPPSPHRPRPRHDGSGPTSPCGSSAGGPHGGQRRVPPCVQSPAAQESREEAPARPRLGGTRGRLAPAARVRRDIAQHPLDVSAAATPGWLPARTAGGPRAHRSGPFVLTSVRPQPDRLRSCRHGPGRSAVPHGLCHLAGSARDAPQHGPTGVPACSPVAVAAAAVTEPAIARDGATAGAGRAGDRAPRSARPTRPSAADGRGPWGGAPARPGVLMKACSTSPPRAASASRPAQSLAPRDGAHAGVSRAPR